MGNHYSSSIFVSISVVHRRGFQYGVQSLGKERSCLQYGGSISNFNNFMIKRRKPCRFNINDNVRIFFSEVFNCSFSMQINFFTSGIKIADTIFYKFGISIYSEFQRTTQTRSLPNIWYNCLISIFLIIFFNSIYTMVI